MKRWSFLWITVFVAVILVNAVQAQDSVAVSRVGQLKHLWPGITSIVCKDDHLYLTDGAALRILDISNPVEPVELGALAINQAQDVAVTDGIACVAAGRNGLRVIDISDPTQPSEVGFCLARTDAIGIAIDNCFAYVALGSDGYQIFLFL